MKKSIGYLLIIVGLGILSFISFFSKGGDQIVLLIGIAAIFLVVGVFFLYQAFNAVPKEKKETEDVSTDVKPHMSIIDKNNALLSEWSKTNETKDRIQLLEMSARVEEQ
jgi:Na+/melibiose symporter-like transporter